MAFVVIYDANVLDPSLLRAEATNAVRRPDKNRHTSDSATSHA